MTTPWTWQFLLLQTAPLSLWLKHKFTDKVPTSKPSIGKVTSNYLIKSHFTRLRKRPQEILHFDSVNHELPLAVLLISYSILQTQEHWEFHMKYFDKYLKLWNWECYNLTVSTLKMDISYQRQPRINYSIKSKLFFVMTRWKEWKHKKSTIDKNCDRLQ